MPPPQARWLANMDDLQVIDAIMERTSNRAILDVLAGMRTGSIDIGDPIPLKSRKRRDSLEPATLPAIKVRITPADGPAWIVLLFYRGRNLEAQVRRIPNSNPR